MLRRALRLHLSTSLLVRHLTATVLAVMADVRGAVACVWEDDAEEGREEEAGRDTTAMVRWCRFEVECTYCVMPDASFLTLVSVRRWQNGQSTLSD